MTHGKFYSVLRLIGDGAGDPALVDQARQHWAAATPEVRRNLAADTSYDGERARIWRAGWDAGRRATDTADLERQARALTAGIRRAVASLRAGYPSDALADLEELL